MTNADRIRAMTDEELAEYIDSWDIMRCPMPVCKHDNGCVECWLEWLRSEADG